MLLDFKGKSRNRYVYGVGAATVDGAVEHADFGLVAPVKAATGVKFAKIEEKDFSFFVQQHPFFAIEVLRIMANRLRNMNQK